MSGKPKSTRLWKEITLALVLKVAVLGIIWAVWFSTPEDRTVDASRITSRFFSQQHQQEHEYDSIRRTR
jgi:hypothetical protein